MFREATKLVLGRGEVYFDRLNGDLHDGERYIGNTPSFRIEREVTRVERKTSYRGQKQRKPGAVVEEKVSGSLTTDHMDPENIATWHGAYSTLDNSGNALLPFGELLSVNRDRSYQLGVNVNGFGLSYIDNAQVRLGGASGAVLTDGVHYSLSRDSGRIYIPITSPLEDGSTIFVQYFKRESSTRFVIPDNGEFFCALRYVATNLIGPKIDYWFPKVQMTPRGAVDLKGDEFRQMSYDFEAMRIRPGSAYVYVIMEKSAPIPITADTALLRADTTRYRADIGAWE